MAEENKSWLDDDPEWQELKRQSEGALKPPKVKKQTISNLKHKIRAITPESLPKETKKVDVSLKLSIPSIKIPTFGIAKLKPPKIKQLSRRQMVIIGTIAIAITCIGTYRIVHDSKQTVATGPTKISSKPDFKTLLPDGKQEDTTSGGVRYDPTKKVASFTDTIDSATLTVSEQPLPDTFKSNPDEEVKKLAEGFSATEVINESNPKAYLGNDVKGPQTVIFHKNDLLVFILSNKPIDKAQWASYITALL